MEGNYNNLFNYKIVYSAVRKKTISFKIVNSTLIMTSPKKVSISFLMKLIESRQEWTLKKIKEKKKISTFLENDKIYFLGNEIKIETHRNSLLTNGGFCELNLDSNTLKVYIMENWTFENLKNLISLWYKNECLNYIENRISYFATSFHLSYNQIKIKEQKTVWGTCNIRNDLTFNWKIMMFEKSVVDYLIVHELVHTIHKNHSSIYWKMVENILPNYKELDKKLKQYKVSS